MDCLVEDILWVVVLADDLVGDIWIGYYSFACMFTDESFISEGNNEENEFALWKSELRSSANGLELIYVLAGKPKG